MPRDFASGPHYCIETKRFLVRTLQPEDVTERYLAWFSDPEVARFIAAAKQRQTLETLRSFIAGQLANPASAFLGIFVGPHPRLHIGNIKFEPIDEVTASATVGVLIGEKTWRGKGVFAEVFAATAGLIHRERGARHFWLGVDDANQAALASYRKAGFVTAEPPADIIPEPRAGCTYMRYSVTR
jgi:[ribosomal protein S5]-alanine N-acetyltransferase